MNLDINKLIDFNLNVINESSEIHKLELQGLDGKILDEHLCITLFDKLISENLIKTDDYRRIVLRTRAYEIINNGGWFKCLIDAENKNVELERQKIIKDNIEVENLKLQKEALVYQKSIRDKEEHIRQLTSDNLRLGNWDIRLRWYIAVVTFVLGIIAKYLIDK